MTDGARPWAAHVVPGAPAPAGPYSHVADLGDLVLTAGFGPQDPRTGAVPDGVAAQTEQTLTNVETALRAVGLGLEHVVRATVHLQHLHEDYDAFNRAYARRMPQPYPVRTTVGSTLAGILVEIDVVAARPRAAGR